MLAAILSGWCPKCLLPSYRSVEESTLQLNERVKLESKKHTRRDGPHAHESRSRLSERELKSIGYHADTPFTEGSARTGCSIYDMLAPDLLHQVSKNFHDFLVHQIFVALGVIHKGIPRTKLVAEIDNRFSQIPMYSKLRWFKSGISGISRWTGQEYKGMSRVFLGIIRGIAPPGMIRVVKAYLDIMRISHYQSHTDKIRRGMDIPEGTLQQLENAIEEFWRSVHDPDEGLVATGLSPFYYTPKLHYLRHYAEYVREKGALPQCSTDRSEALHRNLKAGFNASNRGANAEDFVVRYEARQTGMKYFLNGLLAKGHPISAVGLTELDEDKNMGFENEADEMDHDPKAELSLRQGVYAMAKYQKEKFPMELENTEGYLDIRDKRFLSETLRTLLWI